MIHLLNEDVDHLTEMLELCLCSLVHIQLVLDRVTDDVPQTGAVTHRTGCNLPHRRIADTACRVVDDTLQRLLIIRIRHHAEISDDILDLLALIEAQSSIYSIRYILLAENLLEASALGIGTVENGEIAI